MKILPRNETRQIISRQQSGDEGEPSAIGVLLEPFFMPTPLGTVRMKKKTIYKVMAGCSAVECGGGGRFAVSVFCAFLWCASFFVLCRQEFTILRLLL